MASYSNMLALMPARVNLQYLIQRRQNQKADSVQIKKSAGLPRLIAELALMPYSKSAFQ
jgi:hypothetical protein